MGTGRKTGRLKKEVTIKKEMTIKKNNRSYFSGQVVITRFFFLQEKIDAIDAEKIAFGKLVLQA